MAAQVLLFRFAIVISIVLGALMEPLSSLAESRRANHLIKEKSPYLLQHAYNPVDWYPWGEGAFEKSRKEGKPVFLSIGYSTCHWCHVMERESFSNPDIAKLLNEHFVSIKVDREERPDVDRIYMAAVQAMSGQGGWPLNAFLTPALKPFFGGTYFPPDSRWGRQSFPDILRKTSDLWKSDRKKVLASGEEVGRAVAQYLGGAAEGAVQTSAGRNLPEPQILSRALESYRETFEPRWGGFGGAPKFPMPVDHNFLLGHFALTADGEALRMSAHTLREMAKGGIRDHLGGGFHRYSTDERWHVPHFEKMLYDNAQIAVNYLEAYQATADQEFADIARSGLEYVLRDMTAPEGGFYSAEDADSLPPESAGKVEDRGHEHRTEGAFYVWTRDEIFTALGPEMGELFCRRYGVRPQGNASGDPHGEFRGKNILYLAQDVAGVSEELGKPQPEAAKLLEEGARKLLALRNMRPRPHRDDKIIVSWNGLMLSALAKGGVILEESRYVEAAEKAARLIQKELLDPKTGRLKRRWRQGDVKVYGMADDYSFLIQGLLDLYEATFRLEWLDWAERLAQDQRRLFWDPSGGLFLTAPGDDPNLLARSKEDSDNVEPSASSVAVLNWLRLGQFTSREDFLEWAQDTLAAFSARLSQRPRAFPQMLVALRYGLSQPKQIVIAGDPRGVDTRELLRRVRRRLLPDKILMLVDGGKDQETAARRLPFLKNMTRVEGRATAYVCVNRSCKLPTTDPEILGRILDGKN